MWGYFSNVLFTLIQGVREQHPPMLSNCVVSMIKVFDQSTALKETLQPCVCCSSNSVCSKSDGGNNHRRGRTQPRKNKWYQGSKKIAWTVIYWLSLFRRPHRANQPWHPSSMLLPRSPHMGQQHARPRQESGQVTQRCGYNCGWGKGRCECVRLCVCCVCTVCVCMLGGWAWQ